MVIKKPFVVKESQPIRPVHDFTQNREEWELSVFQNAEHFSVIVFHDKTRYRAEFMSLRAAIEEASKHKRVLLYAITLEGRSVLLPEGNWAEYLRDWEARQ